MAVSLILVKSLTAFGIIWVEKEVVFKMNVSIFMKKEIYPVDI